MKKQTAGAVSKTGRQCNARKRKNMHGINLVAVQDYSNENSSLLFLDIIIALL